MLQCMASQSADGCGTLATDLQQIDQLQQSLKATRRLIAVQEARDRMIPFLRLMMPDPNDQDDVTRSLYEVTPQAKLLSEIIEKVEAGKLKRVAISIGPQMGKSQILSRAAPAWVAGKNPRRHMILGSYNSDFAKDFGFDVRSIMQAAPYRQVFPNFELMLGGEGKDMLVTKDGGKLAFVGVGGSGSGKPADMFVVDDPYRNDQDAQSTIYREMVWKWFNSVALTRAHDKTAIVVVHTRWHQDDLIGRLCDPTHPERKGLYRGLEKRWTYINLPAVVSDPELAKALGLTLEVPRDPDIIEQFGVAPMSALWPGRKSLPLLAEARQSDARTFEALYMGRPSPEEGTYFKLDYLREYDRGELPKQLRLYGASDHAVTSKQARDLNCLGCIGVDENDEIWVLPDLVWRRMETDAVVDELIAQFRAHRPHAWWMENELISKSFGPFLRKRMRREKVWTMIDPVTPMVDIEARARSIQGLMALGMVHFPRFAPWWQQAKQQLMNFPAATHNDFVAWLALIGLGINKQLRPQQMKDNPKEPPAGSMAWILQRSEQKHRRTKIDNARLGW